MTTLEIQARDKSVENDALRKSGFLPAVVYGKKTPSTPITISQKDFMKVWKEAGESGVVNLKGAAGNFDVLIHEISWNAGTEKPDHVDFYAFEKGKKIEVDVPLEFVGVSPAVKDLGGNLMKVLRELKISADPQHIPHSISVDISSLATFDDQITAGDIVLPTGVELVEKPEEVVAVAEEPKAEEVEEAPAEPVDLSAIEVEKKGKKDEEEAAPEK
jgi:large subunit ribosomal protein L25